MAQRAKRPCTTPGCPALTDGGPCEKCRPVGELRPNANQRGYDWQWSLFRRRYLAQHPLCVDCLKADRATPASEVHHKIKLKQRPDLKYHHGNLEGLCKPCHSRRTAKGE